MTFSFNFVSKPGLVLGDIKINVTLDGIPWRPESYQAYQTNLLFRLSGPTNQFGFVPWDPQGNVGYFPRNQDVYNVAAGTYKIEFVGQGPLDALLYDVTPSDTQTLLARAVA